KGKKGDITHRQRRKAKDPGPSLQPASFGIPVRGSIQVGGKWTVMQSPRLSQGISSTGRYRLEAL
uniref:Uncharacterized protein n=1 Tax=Romanomermis culicivorax TaxID=13658 RepID=A0A915HYQ5_ROMCU